jgi:tetratricopeptide (TPR) repeat protein
MKSESSNPSELVDLAETLRREGQIERALQIVKRSLELDPQHPRAILLLGRLLYQDGKISQALDELRSLNSILTGDNGFKTLTQGLEQISKTKDSQLDAYFATESMARLLAQQGYHLEALKVYRQLYLASGGELLFWKGILELRDRLQQEGSRDTEKERVAQEIEQLNNWIKAQQRES